MINKDLEKTIEEAKAALSENDEGRLLYKFRKKIWLDIGSFQKDSVGYRDAHVRRFHLALSCVQKVMPIWEIAFPKDKSINELIAIARKTIGNEVEKDISEKKAYNEWSYFDSLETESESEMRAVSVGYASVNNVYVAVRDEVFHDVLEDELDEDPYMWDTAFYSFLAFTGFGGENPVNIDQNRDFWDWYLSEAVPKAYESIS
ncbi:MAG: Imm5 family immunity protein [Pyrinomonadaceae bacterium]